MPDHRRYASAWRNLAPWAVMLHRRCIEEGIMRGELRIPVYEARPAHVAIIGPQFQVLAAAISCQQQALRYLYSLCRHLSHCLE